MQQKNFTNEIIFKKYKIKKILSTSEFSSVYEGINKINNAPVAVKIEKNNHLKYLESEAYLLIYLKGFGIPKFIGYGKSGNYNILIEELLGLDMESLWEKYRFKEDPFVKNNKIIKDICLLAIQSLERLQYIHSKNVIHRDLKPKNFIIGRKDPNNVYLIDFGFSRKFRSSRTGKHIKYEYKHILMGSLTFASCNAMRGYEQSRRDDLESLGYVLIYLAKGLWSPWKKLGMFIKDGELKNRIKTITKIKMETSEENFCQGLPNEFVSYMKYVKNLEFEEDPDYKYLNSLFLSVLSRNEYNNNLNFFWMIKPKTKSFPKKINSEKEKEEINNTFKKLNHTQVRGSSKNRLYNSIKNSLNNMEKFKEFRNNTLEIGTSKIPNNLNLKKNDFKEDYLKIKAKNLKYVPKVLNNNNRNKIYINNINNNINRINNNIDKRNNNNINRINNNINNRINNRINNKINNNNFINQTANSNQNIKVYNEINYNNLYFINDNFSTKNSNLTNNMQKGIINYKMNFKGNRTYKRIMKEKK